MDTVYDDADLLPAKERPEYEPVAATADHATVALLKLLQRKDYRFTTVTPMTHGRVNRRPENARAVDLRGIFGWNRPFSSDVAGDEMMELMHAAGLLTQRAGLWRSRARISSLGDQLFMHSAYPTTQANAVFFGPDTYRFTNAITASLAARTNSIRRAIDIGSGAGPGAMTIAAACPQATVFATDINDSALRMTALNAAAAGLPNVVPIRCNLLNDIDGTFDLIVSNPPYLVDAGERTYRHGGGRMGEGLSIEIVKAALPRMAPGGTLLLYTGVAIVDGQDPFIAAVEGCLDEFGYKTSYSEIDPDIFAEELSTEPYRHAERIAAVLLSVTRP